MVQLFRSPGTAVVPRNQILDCSFPVAPFTHSTRHGTKPLARSHGEFFAQRDVVSGSRATTKQLGARISLGNITAAELRPSLHPGSGRGWLLRAATASQEATTATAAAPEDMANTSSTSYGTVASAGAPPTGGSEGSPADDAVAKATARAAADAEYAAGGGVLRTKRPPGMVKRSVAIHLAYVGTAFKGEAGGGACWGAAGGHRRERGPCCSCMRGGQGKAVEQCKGVHMGRLGQVRRGVSALGMERTGSGQ